MVVNARKVAGVINPNTGDAMELDIYMPSLNLGFEYQVGQVFLLFFWGGRHQEIHSLFSGVASLRKH